MGINFYLPDLVKNFEFLLT